MKIVLKKLLPIALAAIFLTGCSSQEQRNNEPLALADDKSRIVGIWAMLPLRNGIANVSEYRPDGKVLLHSFNCSKPAEQEIEVSDYSVVDGGQSIHIKSLTREFDLKVLEFSRVSMRLGMSVSGSELTLGYMKVDKVAPLCALYKAPAEEPKPMAYRQSDFVPAPTIPTHTDIDLYIGRWANAEENVQVEIVKDTAGNAYVYMASTENWHHLYNDVHWIGNELHFQSYSYSEKKDLFSHPYHKSTISTILQPKVDGQMQHSFFIGERRFDYVLKRVD